MDQQELQKKIEQYKRMQETLQYFVIQKQEILNTINETENALKELENYNGKVYKLVGTILIEKEKEEIVKSLTEEKDILNLKLKSIEKQESSLKDSIGKLGAELQNILNAQGYSMAE